MSSANSKDEVETKYFRNKIDIFSIENIDVDAESLWFFNKDLNLFILVDEDQFITSDQTVMFTEE